MGIFDAIKDALAGGTPPRRDANAHRPRSTPAPAADPAKDALRRAQSKRAATPLPTAKGKIATKRVLLRYEHLERSITLRAGHFPWNAAEAEGILAAKGFDPAHVRAYLASPAAKRLLE